MCPAGDTGNEMSMKKYYALRDTQVRILILLYRFRFVTVAQLAGYRNVSPASMHESLEKLVERGLIDKRYDSSFKLQGKPARYYLAKAGIRYMRVRFGVSERILKSYYKNPLVGDAFIDHTVALFDLYRALHNTYTGVFDIFTKAEIAPYEFFPATLPDLYLQRIEDIDDVETAYILELFDTTPFFAIKKRIREHIEHFDSGEWPDETYPTLLLVCPDQRTEARLEGFLEPVLADIDFLTTTIESVIAETEKATIWADPVEPEVPRRL